MVTLRRRAKVRPLIATRIGVTLLILLQADRDQVADPGIEAKHCALRPIEISPTRHTLELVPGSAARMAIGADMPSPSQPRYEQLGSG